MSLTGAERVAEAIAALRGPEPVLVGIDGRGDTSTRLAAEVGATAVVRATDFARTTAEHAHDALDPQSTFELWFDWQRLMTEVLDQLILGQPATVVGPEGGAGVEVMPRGVIVVAGPFVLRPQLRGYFDLTVWVDGGDGTSPPELAAAEDWYVENLRPAERADVVVSGPGQ